MQIELLFCKLEDMNNQLQIPCKSRIFPFQVFQVGQKNLKNPATGSSNINLDETVGTKNPFEPDKSGLAPYTQFFHRIQVTRLHFGVRQEGQANEGHLYQKVTASKKAL